MATGSNLFLCILFSVLNGLFLAISAVLPAFFSAKDREVDDNKKEKNGILEDTREDESEDELSYGDEENPQDLQQDEAKKESFNEDHIDALVDAMTHKYAFQNNVATDTDEKQNYEDIKGKVKTSPCMWKIVSVSSVLMQLLGGYFAYLALLYGPISVCTPIMSCSLLICSVIIMAYILKLETKPNKETRVGNYIILASVILVVFTGPIVDDTSQSLSKEDLQAQLLAPASITVILVMVGIFILTLPHINIVIFHEKSGGYFSDNVNFIAFQVSMLIMGSFMASCLKVFSNSEGWLFWANIGLFVVCFVVFPVVSVYQNIVIKNPATFVSINAGLTYLLNVLVGLICWKDQVRNWGGYVVSWTLFLLGIYLVCDIDLVEEWSKRNSENAKLSLEGIDEANDAHFSIVPDAYLSTAPTLHFSLVHTTSPTRFSITKRRTIPNHYGTKKSEIRNIHDDYSC